MVVQRHLFILDPVEYLNLRLDSSLRLAHALTYQGHQAFITHGERLSWHTKNGALASAATLSFPGNDPMQCSIGTYGPCRLEDFDSIHMRKDPPFDMNYISITWLLDAAATRIYNSPNALRTINEKLAVLMFPEFSRKALVSADAAAIVAFIRDECNGEGIIKPLDLFGGRGVMRLTLSDAASEIKALSTLAQETASGRNVRLVQAFDPAIFQGEVRAFAAFGEPLAWCLKRPATGNFLANTAAGATLSAYQPSESEIETVTTMAKTLAKEGVVMVGFDIIGGYISEMNITSPRLLVPPGDQRNYYGILAERVQGDALARP